MDDPSRNELELDLTHVDYNQRSIGSWICCLPCYWLKRNNSFHEIFLSAVTLLVTVLLVASPVLFLISSIPEDKPRQDQNKENECLKTKSEKVCLEEECVMAAKRILASVSWKTDPCRDFSRFACGSSSETFEVSSVELDLPKVSNSETLHSVHRTIRQLLAAESTPKSFQKLEAFYKSCIRAGDKRISLLPMFSALKTLGGYVGPGDHPPQDLTNLIVSLHRLNGAPLFDIYLDSDAYNGSDLKPPPVIDLPFHFGYNWRSWYKNRKNFISKIWQNRFLSSFNTQSNYNRKEKREVVMKKILKEFVSGNTSSELKAKEIEKIFLFDGMIAEARSKEMTERRSRPMEISGRTNLKDLQSQYPFIRWQNLFEEFLARQLSVTDAILVLAPAYMDDLRKILPRFSSRATHNSLLVIFATDTLYELVNGSSISDRSNYCTDVTVNAFSKAVSLLYISQFEKEQQNQIIKVNRMISGLQKEFEKITKFVFGPTQKAIETFFGKILTKYEESFTFSDFWNATLLMENVRADSENFFENVIRRYRDLRKVSIDEVGFDTDVIKVDDIIPLAVISQLYFSDHLPLYLSYSTIGLALAREVFYDFYLERTRRAFAEKSGTATIRKPVALNIPSKKEIECLSKQKTSVFWQKLDLLQSKIDFQLDWSSTYSKSFADLKGLQISLEAWKQEKNVKSEAKLFESPFNARQMFFLNAAQTYCSIFSSMNSLNYVSVLEGYSERVNEVMMNSPDFAEAYNCSIGSPMNPRKKCLAG